MGSWSDGKTNFKMPFFSSDCDNIAAIGVLTLKQGNVYETLTQWHDEIAEN